ncbi:NAD-glutamate dehydrogenase domain-containing protein [Nocardia rhamnosiphila]
MRGGSRSCPGPRPRYEIFVHPPAVAGVHIRFGSVARGGHGNCAG